MPKAKKYAVFTRDLMFFTSKTEIPEMDLKHHGRDHKEIPFFTYSRGYLEKAIEKGYVPIVLEDNSQKLESDDWWRNMILTAGGQCFASRTGIGHALDTHMEGYRKLFRLARVGWAKEIDFGKKHPLEVLQGLGIDAIEAKTL